MVSCRGGANVASVQFVSLVARRIHCYVSEGGKRQRGERYGFFRFGSPVDFVLPEHFSVKVALGDNV